VRCLLLLRRANGKLAPWSPLRSTWGTSQASESWLAGVGRVPHKQQGRCAFSSSGSTPEGAKEAVPAQPIDTVIAGSSPPVSTKSRDRNLLISQAANALVEALRSGRRAHQLA